LDHTIQTQHKERTKRIRKYKQEKFHLVFMQYKRYDGFSLKH